MKLITDAYLPSSVAEKHADEVIPEPSSTP
jgi:hypothetical protein